MLSVLIPTHGRPTLLGRTLASLAACDIPDEYVETVIIENGPKSGAEAVVGDAAVDYPHLNLRYMHVERANKSHALNEALKTIADGLVVFFDDDIRIDAHTLVAYAEAASEQKDRVYFGGPVRPDFEAPPPAWRLGTMPASVRGWEPESLEAVNGRPFLGANWAAMTSDIVAARGFDDGRGPGAESKSTGQESDMQRRLQAYGLGRCYLPDAIIWHYVPKERCSISWNLRRSYRSGVENGLEGIELATTIGDGKLSIIMAVGAQTWRIARHVLSLERSRSWYELNRLFRLLGTKRGMRKSRESYSPRQEGRAESITKP